MGAANPLVAGQQAAAAMAASMQAVAAGPCVTDGKGAMVAAGMDPGMLQVMMAMHSQGMAGAAAAAQASSQPGVAQTYHGGEIVSAGVPGALVPSDVGAVGEALDPRGGAQAQEGRRKQRNKLDRPVMAGPEAIPRERGGAGGKSERRRRDRGGGGGGGAGAEEERISAAGGGKSRSDRGPPPSSPLIEQLKAKDRNVELSDLSWNISEIAQDQYGSRLIQQKLEVASDEEKQVAFKAVLQRMPQLTVDVFGNYVIQKFFEYGNAEQRRILAEQLVGQVLRLSLQMYGCRVVQKALDSVPIEQQVLLIGELKGHVIRCIEDQHGNHVIQKCIERLPTDRINFVVESFEGNVCRMAKHCYGCRVIQRLIEYCSSSQISVLLEEVLANTPELATDQYGNYVVQHVMEHSSRPGDRHAILHIFRKNILSLSCHKYASNVVEKALSCSTPDERALIIGAIVGDHGEPHPPLITMMRDRFGNYIVQRTIGLATGPLRDALIWKLQEQMPALKKSNTYGKHIISALERAQAQAVAERGQ